MPRSARSRPLTLAGLMIRIALFPFLVIGVFMLGTLVFSALSIVVFLLARIFS
jgi:hypothetical protein